MNKILFVALIGLSLAAAASNLFREELYQSEFSKFITTYNKKYNHEVFFQRYKVFKANFDKIHVHNEGKHSYTMAMNAFGDMPFDEFHATHTGFNHVKNDYIRSKNVAESTKLGTEKPLAAAVDWRTAGAVTPVKDQGQCGSCWAFSATGSMEGAWFLNKKSLISLSEQQLVDCSDDYGNEGCNGGLMDQAFEYVIANKGITTEAKYPYTARDGTCKTGNPLPVTISSYSDVKANNDAAMGAAVAMGPVSVAIEADQESFQFYSGGVFSDPTCGTQLDHGVLAVGYNTSSDGTNYFIVKNSWGANWGDHGYIMMARKNGAGECGINMAASYPIV